ncbi:hypothetical protein ES705_29097 [subsurface metagenome]
MATITFSPLIAGIRGRTADAVFSSWKGRPYVRQHVIPANPQTDAQTAVRNSLAECVAIWQQLSTLMQEGYAKAAANLNISGYNDMVGRNRKPVQLETGLIGPRRNTDAARPRIDIPINMVLGNQLADGKAKFTWTDPEQGDDYWFGLLDYDLTTNSLLHMRPAICALDAGEFIQTGYTVDDKYAATGFVHRISDGEMVHCMTWGWTQNL